MRAIIAGGGIGGLTAALALHARGASVDLFERASVLTEAGAGVQLGPNAVRVLDGLGLGDGLRSIGSAPVAAEIRDADSGRLLLRTPLGEAAHERWGAPYLQVHRSDLQRLLIDTVEQRGAARMSLGVEVTSVGADGQVGLSGGACERYDVVIGADGLRSRVAASLFGDDAPRFTGQVAWRAVVDRAVVDAPVDPVAAVWIGAGRHLVCYPLRGGRSVNIVAVVEQDWREEGWRQSGDPHTLAGLFADWPVPVPQLLRAVSETWRWALFDRAPRPQWSRGRATLLGDAAHPMLPFLAQGAAMAIEDAAVLAARLEVGPSVEAALAAYEHERRPRTSKVQAWSRRNARLFHLPPSLARAAFGAASLLDGPSKGMSRFDWLYGWRP